MSFDDVVCALVTATTAAQGANGAWKVTGGVDMGRDALDVVVLIDRGDVVVTVF